MGADIPLQGFIHPGMVEDFSFQLWQTIDTEDNKSEGADLDQSTKEESEDQ